MIRSSIITLASLALTMVAACDRAGPVVSGFDAPAAEVCARESGDYRRVCVAQEYMCVKRYADAGKSCRDSSECEGECRIEVTTVCDEAGKCVEPSLPKPGDAAIGACQADTDPCGSVIPVKGGVAQQGENRD